MNFIKEIICSIKSGSYSGKGNKHTQKGDFRKAIFFYEKALEYSSENSGSTIIFQECIARNYARLENFEKALTEAEKCLEILNSTDGSTKPIKDAKSRIESFINAIKSNELSTTNQMLVK